MISYIVMFILVAIVDIMVIKLDVKETFLNLLLYICLCILVNI